MTENKLKRKLLDLKALFSEEKDGLKDILLEVMQEVFEQEMADTLGLVRESAPRAGWDSVRDTTNAP